MLCMVLTTGSTAGATSQLTVIRRAQPPAAVEVCLALVPFSWSLVSEATEESAQTLQGKCGCSVQHWARLQVGPQGVGMSACMPSISLVLRALRCTSTKRKASFCAQGGCQLLILWVLMSFRVAPRAWAFLRGWLMSC